jgi:hypothetical protein
MSKDCRSKPITLQSRVSNVLYAAHASFTVFPEPALTLPP